MMIARKLHRRDLFDRPAADFHFTGLRSRRRAGSWEQRKDDVAMVLGTVGGALAGNEIQKKHDQPVPGQQIIVRTTNGVLVAVTQPVNAGLRVGQRVYIEGNGDGARVVQQ